MCSKKVNDLQSLRTLRDNLRAYYGCGYNRKKYERYLKLYKEIYIKYFHLFLVNLMIYS